jgi:serine/threonine protein kinase
VKGANILLNSKLEAKIADFGLTKAFNREDGTQVSTNSLVGTRGYVDPEYVNPDSRLIKPLTTFSIVSWTIHPCNHQNAQVPRDG